MLRKIIALGFALLKKFLTVLKNKSLLLVFLSSLLLGLSFSRYNLGFLAWFALCPFLLAIENKNWQKRILLFFVLGALSFFLIIFWLVHVSFLGLVATSIYLGLWFGFFGIFSLPASRPFALLVTPLSWVLLERMRGIFFNGFGWGVIAYTQHKNIWLIQIADKIGIGGISFLIVFINVVICRAIKNFKQEKTLRKSQRQIAVSLILFMIIYFYGGFCLQKKFPGIDLSVSVIQGNIQQEKKWDPVFRHIKVSQTN